MSQNDLSPIGEAARWACILEVCAPKAGNVHPHAPFADATAKDFIESGEVIAPILDRAVHQPVGRTILDCVIATQQAIGHNTNLGIILLLAPLCSIPSNQPIWPGIERVLASLTVQDAQLTFEAIRLAKPGGLGKTSREDVRSHATVTLRNAMELAADRDAIARQYRSGFADVISTLAEDVSADGDRSQVIVLAHIRQMAREPDTLIARKCGSEVAIESSRRAQQTLELGWPGTQAGRRVFAELDAWLRADGHRRNPGTSADLIAAGLFVALRQGRIKPPFEWVQRLLI